MNPRIVKVNELIKQETGKIILSEINLPLGVLLTVIEAKVSADLRYADVFVSIYPESRREEILDTVDKNIYAIQKEINKKLSMKPVPKIRFKADTTGANVERINELIRKSKEQK